MKEFLLLIFLLSYYILRGKEINQKEIWLKKNTCIKNVPITNLKIIGKKYTIFREGGRSNYSYDEYEYEISGKGNIIAFYIEEMENYSFHSLYDKGWIYPSNFYEMEELVNGSIGVGIDIIKIEGADFYVAITCNESQVLNQTIGCVEKADCKQFINNNETLCIDECMEVEEWYMSNQTNKTCLVNCKSNGLYILNKENYECINECPKYLSPQTATCVETCENETYKYYRNYNNNTYNYYEGCFKDCKTEGFYITEPGSFECIEDCDNYINGNNDTCLISCNETEEFYDEVLNPSKFCIHDCFDSDLFYVYYNNTASCSKRCPYHYFIKERNNCSRDSNFFEKNKKENITSNYFYDPITEEKIYLKNNESCIDEFPYENKKTYECIQNCSFTQISNSLDSCQITNNKKLIEKTHKDIIENYIINKNNNPEKFSKTIKGRNITFDLFSTKSGIKFIDLLECEQKLKEKNSISENSPLYILKLNITTLDSTDVQLPLYEVYDPNTGNKLDLTPCNGMKARIQIWRNIAGEEFKNFIKMKESGFDIYNDEDPFYTDYCTVFSTDGGTELTLKDRKAAYKRKNNICPDTCEYYSINDITKELSCNCVIDAGIVEEKNTEEKFSLSFIKKFFTETLLNLNLKMVKCSNAFFTKDGITKNISFYVNSIILISHTVITIIVLKTSEKRFQKILGDLKELKFSHTKEIKEEPPKRQKLNYYNNIKLLKNINKENKNNLNIFKSNNENISTKTIESSTTRKFEIKTTKKSENSNDKKDNNNENNNDNIITVSKYKPKGTQIKKNKEDITIKIKYTDLELNIMDYKNASMYDKRNFWNIYKSYIFNKHPIISTFLYKKDYNIIYMKFNIILLTISTTVCVNSLFFTDETISKINSDGGKFNFIYQLPETLITTLISALLIFCFKKMALSQDCLLEIRKAKTKESFNEQVFKFLKSVKKKFIAYSIISEIFLLFIWYYLGCFCSIFKNGQFHLYKSFLISYVIGNLYPFVLNTFPALLRMVALKDDNSNKKRTYKISQFLGLF